MVKLARSGLNFLEVFFVFDQLLAIVNLGEKLPEAVGWEYTGPYRISLPEEVLDAIADKVVEIESVYSVSAISVYNYSTITKAEIRVLYSGSFELRPKVHYRRRSAPVKWKHDTENHEFVFYDIPPNEEIEVELFNVYKGFSVNQVLVDGKLITEFMNKRAIAKAFPEFQLPKAALIFCVCLCVLVLVMTAYTSYGLYKQRQDNELLSAATGGDIGCSLYVYDNPPSANGKEILTRKIKKLEPWMKQLLIAKNKVATEADLYDLDRLILCTPGSM